jgi:putative phosphoesterase
MKIGLISDTHMAGSGRQLPQVVLGALSGVDLILHCGDLECLGVLDYLETVAPVLAVRGYEDPVEPGERLAHTTRVVVVEGVSIGMVHDIQWPTPWITTSPDGATLRFPQGSVRGHLIKRFGQPVDMVLFGDTHEELICLYQGVMWVNPGSPTYPGRRHARGSLGTIGILDVDQGVINAELVALEAGEPPAAGGA